MEKKKILCFHHMGELYKVNEQGKINANGIGYYSKDWIFLGGTKHHWSNHITITLEMAFEKPELLNGCLGFDNDHGTTREWGGSYYGKLPRITGAHVVNE